MWGQAGSDMYTEDLIREVDRLLHKVRAAEDFLRRAEAYYVEHSDEWSDEIAGGYQDALERKREQIEYEWHVIELLGQKISAGIWYPEIEI